MARLGIGAYAGHVLRPPQYETSIKKCRSVGLTKLDNF